MAQLVGTTQAVPDERNPKSAQDLVVAPEDGYAPAVQVGSTQWIPVFVVSPDATLQIPLVKPSAVHVVEVESEQVVAAVQWNPLNLQRSTELPDGKAPFAQFVF